MRLNNIGGGSKSLTDWQGLVVIMHPDRSEVAKRLQIARPGSYALKVNIR